MLQSCETTAANDPREPVLATAACVADEAVLRTEDKESKDCACGMSEVNTKGQCDTANLHVPREISVSVGRDVDDSGAILAAAFLWGTCSPSGGHASSCGFY